MKLNLISTKEILDVEKEIGYELEVNERPSHMNLHKYYVSFKNGETMEGCCLVSHSGNGNTIDEALIDYCKQISNRRMVFGSMTPEREEILLPKLVHTKGRTYR